jgi:hypothetical protein
MLTPEALVDLMASDTPHAVLDLRERGTYERGHVFRTTSLPRRQLEFRVPTLITAPATPIALLDGDGDGLVISSLFGRSETRVFAKPVQGGQSKYTLTDEEQEAIELAGPSQPAGAR